MLVTIGVDPHKGSHTAVAIDVEETKLGEVRVSSAKDQCDQLLGWPRPSPSGASPSSQRPGSATCWPNSSWPPARRCSMCPRRWRLG